MCPQSCSLAKAVVLSPVYTAVTWQWVYISQYLPPLELQISHKKVVLATCDCFAESESVHRLQDEAG
jgi:hypothetical protein